MYAERLGAARVPGTNPFAQLEQAGVALALGSDSPVTPFDPWGAVWGAVLHHEPAARLDVRSAIAAHTAGGWAAAREVGGVLRVGAPATLAVWDVADAGPDGVPLVAEGAPAERAGIQCQEHQNQQHTQSSHVILLMRTSIGLTYAFVRALWGVGRTKSDSYTW